MNENNKHRVIPTGTSSESLRQWIALLAGGMVVFLAAALFGIGRAIRAGYLYSLGLDLDQVPEDFYGYLYWGYVVGTPLLVLWLGYVGIALLLIFGSSWAIGRGAKRWGWIRRMLESWENFPRKDQATSHWKYAAFAYLVFAIGYLVLVTHLLMSQAHEVGQRAGRVEVQKLQSTAVASGNHQTQWIEIWLDSTPPRVERGYRLLCTEKLCSIYDPVSDRRTIRIIPLDGLREIRVFESRPIDKASRT